MLRYRLRAFVVVLVAAGSASAFAQAPPDPSDVFFDDSVIHEIRLNINSRDWESLKIHYLDNDYYTCDFRWRDQVARNIAIRSRGTGSRSGIKPGLRVDFDRNVTGQKFLGLKSVILRNDTQDPSTMRERISMLFFRRMGLPASRGAHTRLFVNNAYVGLYTIVESVDKTFLKKTFNENDGWLYKYDYNTDDTPYYLEYRGSNANLYVPHPFKPETRENEPPSQPIADMIRIINQDSDAIFRTTIARYLDLVKFIKHIAVEMFLGDNDGFNGNYGTNNFYFYRFENKNVFTFIAWDKSNAFMDGPKYPIWHNIYDVPEPNRNRLTIRVLGYDDLKNLFMDTLLDCATSLSELDPEAPDDTRGWMEREIQKEYDQIKDSAAVAEEDLQYYSKAQFEQEVENLRTFARQRSDFVRSEVAKTRGQQ